MKLEVNIEKKYAFLIVGILLVIGAGLFVYAYNAAGSGGTPSLMGHSVDEIDWSQQIQGSINAAGDVCGGGRCLSQTELVGSYILKPGIMSATRLGTFTYDVPGVASGTWAVRIDFRGEPDRGCQSTITTTLNGVSGPSFYVATDNEWAIANGNYYNPAWIINVVDSGPFANKISLALVSGCGMTAWGNLEAHKIS